MNKFLIVIVITIIKLSHSGVGNFERVNDL